MTSVVICEKPSQARAVYKAIGDKFGQVLPAQGHLIGLVEPKDVNPDWAAWGYDILRPSKQSNGGLFPTKESAGDGGARKRLSELKRAIKGATRVIVATDADREGTLIGGELLAHYGFKGDVFRAYFTAEDGKTLRNAFDNLLPWEGAPAREYDAGVARQQADTIYSLTLTRALTKAVAQRGTVIGVGRVRTPTLAIVCRRELEIRNFKPESYFEVTALTSQGEKPDEVRVELRHKRSEADRIMDHRLADAIALAATGFQGPLKVTKESKRQGPEKLPDLPTLQKTASRQKGWSAAKTLQVLQALYETHQIVTYPRAEARYLPEAAINDIETLKGALQNLPFLREIDLGETKVRQGKNGIFSNAGLVGCSHHAVAPNVNTSETFASVYGRLSADEKWLFEIVARSYVAAIMADHVYEQTRASLMVPYVYPEGAPGQQALFEATGRVPVVQGWRAVRGSDRGPKDNSLPPLKDGETARIIDAHTDAKKTEPPKRYDEGTLIDAMQNAWKFIADEALRDRLKEAKGIGTPATRAEIISGLKSQSMIAQEGKLIVPTPGGMAIYDVLTGISSNLVDPGLTAQWEMLLDAVQLGNMTVDQVLDGIEQETATIVSGVREREGSITLPDAVVKKAPRSTRGKTGKPRYTRRKRKAS